MFSATAADGEGLCAHTVDDGLSGAALPVAAGCCVEDPSAGCDVSDGTSETDGSYVGPFEAPGSPVG